MGLRQLVNKWETDSKRDIVVYRCRTCGSNQVVERSEAETTMDTSNYPNLEYVHLLPCLVCEKTTNHKLVDRLAIFEDGKHWPEED